MRKLLFPLLCFSLIFSSCQENNAGALAAPPSSSSSVCGTATLTVGSTNYTLNNPLINTGTCSNVAVVSVTAWGNPGSVFLSFQNMYSNNWEHEWALKLQFIGAFTIGTSILGWDSTPPLFLAQLTLGSNTNNLTTVLYQSYLSLTSPNGEITITNIDSTNNTIDGNFSCTVYHVYTAKDSTSLLINHTTIPSNIGAHYVVYIDDPENPSAIVGYHDNINDTWYDTNGLKVADPIFVAEAAGGKAIPYLATNSTPQLISGSFSDIPLLP